MSNYPKELNQWPEITVYGCDFRNELLMMANTVEKLGLWEWFKEYTPPKDKGFMFCGHNNVTKISNNLEVNDHSGATVSYCMRCMEYIAKNGFDDFKNKNTK